MWMRVDDGMHAHRKTRVATKSHPDKRRDAAAMGLWVLAGSWAGRNSSQTGWVPADELDRFDDEWEALAARLVRAGYWWPEQHNGEDGYGFNDWHEWNNPDGASKSGTFGNHVRWHVGKGVVKDDCEHCPKEPQEPEEPETIGPTSGASRPDDRPDIAPESGRESLRDHRPDSLTRPDPTRPDPTDDAVASSGASAPAAGKPARKPSRATRLPDDWQPTDAHRAIADERGVDLGAEVEKFRDWTLSNGATKKDWDATFRNWLRNARPSQRPAGKPERETGVQIGLRLVEELRAQEQAGQADIREIRGAW